MGNYPEQIGTRENAREVGDRGPESGYRQIPEAVNIFGQKKATVTLGR